MLRVGSFIYVSIPVYVCLRVSVNVQMLVHIYSTHNSKAMSYNYYVTLSDTFRICSHAVFKSSLLSKAYVILFWFPYWAIQVFFYFYFYWCSSTVVSIFPHHSLAPHLPLHPSPPPTLSLTPFWLCPWVLYTYSLATLPRLCYQPHPHPLWLLSVCS